MKKIIILFVTLLCSSTLAATESNTTKYFILSPSLLHFDYTEYSTTGTVLDRERGWLPGIEARLNYPFASTWSFDIHSSYHTGTVDYVGQTQSGTAHTTDTGTNLFRIGGKVNKKVYRELNVFVGAQLHQWDRDIKDNNNVSGIYEVYKWFEYSIGLSSDVFVNQNDTFNVDVAYLLIRNGTLDVDLSRVDLGTTQLDLGDSNGARLNLNWKRINENNIHYGISLFFEGWDFGRSNTKSTTGGSPNVLVTEPRSETRNAGLKFNIEYLF